jgi:ABC-type uncharacterized transport system fused permease/ATPase subunit
MLLDRLPQAVVMTIDRREVLREFHHKVVELAMEGSGSTQPRPEIRPLAIRSA